VESRGSRETVDASDILPSDPESLLVFTLSCVLCVCVCVCVCVLCVCVCVCVVCCVLCVRAYIRVRACVYRNIRNFQRMWRIRMLHIHNI